MKIAHPNGVRYFFVVDAIHLFFRLRDAVGDNEKKEDDVSSSFSFVLIVFPYSALVSVEASVGAVVSPEVSVVVVPIVVVDVSL